MTDWLGTLVSQHKKLESPESFWFWSGIAAISAILKDQVWLDAQIHKIYPNIYVMLHGESGIKKGPPISMAKQLVKAVNNTRLIVGRSSIQGILKELGQGYTIPNSGGKIMAKSQAFICSSELSSSIIDDPVATKILTDLYDRNYNFGEWASLLKMENFKLNDPTITMLTATNEAMAEDFFTKSAIKGGYFARTFIVYEETGTNINSLMFPMRNKPDYTLSGEYLKELAKLHGPFAPLAMFDKTDEYKYKRIKFDEEVYFNEAGMIYDDWYEEFRKHVKETELKDETGTLNRFGDSVLKVAMLLSLAKAPQLILRADAVSEAIIHCEKLIGNVRKTTLGKQGMSSTALLKANIIQELLSRPNYEISRAMLSKKFAYHYGSIEELDGLMVAFEASGLIRIYSESHGIIYRMVASQAEELKKFLAGKSRK